MIKMVTSIKTYDNIQKIGPVQGDDYTTCSSLDYSYFKKRYEIVAIDLSKQQTLDADLKAIQQIGFPGNLDRDGKTKIFSLLKKLKQPF